MKVVPEVYCGWKASDGCSSRCITSTVIIFSVQCFKVTFISQNVHMIMPGDFTELSLFFLVEFRYLHSTAGLTLRMKIVNPGFVAVQETRL
jgi:hypothetical protein